MPKNYEILSNAQIESRAVLCREEALDFITMKPLTDAPILITEISPGVEVKTHYNVVALPDFACGGR
jgi:hypothetical protein